MNVRKTNLLATYGTRHFLSDAAMARFEPRYASTETYIQGLQDEFFFFVFELWRATRRDDPEKRSQLGWVEEDVCHWVQHGPRLRYVLAQRFFGKTSIITCPFGLWRAFKRPDQKTLIISKTGRAKAQEFVTLSRNWISNVFFLRHMDPRDSDTLRDSTMYGFDIAGMSSDDKVPSFKSTGIDGAITGSRAHTCLPDDIEDGDNASSITMRAAVHERTREFSTVAQYRLPHQAIDEPGGEVVGCGTFHDEESVYHLMAADGYEFRTWPALYPEPGQEFLGLAPSITERLNSGKNKPGDILLDYRVSHKMIAAEQKKGARWFGLQMLCQANMRESNRYPLRLSNLIVFDSPHDKAPSTLAWGEVNSNHQSTAIRMRVNGWPGDTLHEPVYHSPPSEWKPYQITAAAIDPGGSGKSETIVAIGSSLNGYIHVHELKAFKGGGTPQNFAAIAELLKHHRATSCTIEGNLFGANDPNANPWVNLLQVELNRLADSSSEAETPWGCSALASWNLKKKEDRIIAALATLMDSHRLVVCRRVAADEELQYQISRLTSVKGALDKTDRVDALAQLVVALSSTTSIDPDFNPKPLSTADRIRQQLNDLLQTSSSEPNWCQF
jgi:hypothetical protein